ncbi:GTP 3',8-cyclase MoaA [Kocuria tytonis]|uniref:GTP 3',8-cyclase n=1 Tax=Kocuria tytonis TaxID=2054280 RepID=A0A495ADK0_9MICC|nr:GTP 3',8-cyclase MoaA [Kocuria tytonis]RKQ36955.1 GTP 3',8-cyclase MoaA [Kocuria tytonis]
MSVFLGNPQVLPSRGVPTRGPLTDRFGRTATDLRISITDKCNLRCTYCMPAEGMQWLPRESLLTVAEIVRLARIAVSEFGVREIRLTGGEPLIRPDLEDLVRALRRTMPGIPVSMTSNGIGLAARAQGLADAGMNRVNISLDTLCADTYATLARRGKLAEALAGVAAAQRAGMNPVKLNAVLMRGVNDHEAPQLLHWALENHCDLRFIEQMPLDADHGWTRENMVTAADIRESLAADFDLAPDRVPRAGAPAEKHLVRRRGEERVLGTVGIIASVTEPFCEDCTRTRITAEGHVRSCLFSHHETDLMHLLRSGASDADVTRRWREAMWVKPRAHGMDHTGLDSGDYVQPDRSMSAIGG